MTNEKPKHNQTIKGYLYVIISAVIFGCMPLMARYIYADGVNSLTLVLLRNLLSMPVLGLLAFLQHRTLRAPIKAIPQLSLIALMGCALTPLLLFSSYQFIASGTATVFHFVYPAAVVIGGFLFLREKISRGRLFSVLLCVIGICFFYTPGEALDWRGSLLALVSGITYAIYILLLSHYKPSELSGFLFTFYIVAFSAALMLIVCLVSGQLTLPASPAIWLLCFFFAVVVNGGAVVLFQQGTFLIGGQRASILSTAEPLTSIIAGALVLHETLSYRTGIGSLLVIAACILIAVSDMRNNR